ncbi:MAG: mercuric transporter MerT family protein [Massilia sp.]
MQAQPVSAAEPRSKLGFGLMALAVAASLLASTCCVLPLVLVLAGITGAWMANLAVLKPVTPVFIGLALVALGWAGYLVFRPANVCAPGANSACETARPVMRRVFVGCALFIAALLMFPLIAPVFY